MSLCSQVSKGQLVQEQAYSSGKIALLSPEERASDAAQEIYL